MAAGRENANMWHGRGNSGGSWPSAFPRSLRSFFRFIIHVAKIFSLLFMKLLSSLLFITSIQSEDYSYSLFSFVIHVNSFRFIFCVASYQFIFL